MKHIFLFVVCFLLATGCTTSHRCLLHNAKSDVATILLCEAVYPFFVDLFSDLPFEGETRTTLKPLCAITDPDQIEAIVSEMTTNETNTDGFPYIGILCYLVLLDASSNVVNAAHIVNWRATIIYDHVIREGDTLILSSTPDFKMFYSKPIARIAYDTLLEKYPDRIKKMDDSYQRDCQKTTEELLMNGIESEP